jgi:hypothetical protein
VALSEQCVGCGLVTRCLLDSPHSAHVREARRVAKARPVVRLTPPRQQPDVLFSYQRSRRARTAAAEHRRFPRRFTRSIPYPSNRQGLTEGSGIVLALVPRRVPGRDSYLRSCQTNQPTDPWPLVPLPRSHGLAVRRWRGQLDAEMLGGISFRDHGGLVKLERGLRRQGAREQHNPNRRTKATWPVSGGDFGT